MENEEEKPMSSCKTWLVLTVLALASMGVVLAQERPAPSMSFFITSAGPGDGGNLGGLKGADAHCSRLAAAAGAGNKTWRAYLSAAGEKGGADVHARDRIGNGPWFNFKGVQVAASVADLHSENNKLSKESSLTEKGAMINGVSDKPNMHDIITGSTADGRLAPAVRTAPARSQPPNSPDRTPINMTCNNWTTSTTDWNSFTKVGHHDRMGGGAAATSWNSSHETHGCSQEQFTRSGGAGLFYCFAAN
jgi:hypothetical protein